MSIVDSKLVEIEISTFAGERNSGLRLNYQGQKYNLVQAFASHKSELVQERLQQLMTTNHYPVDVSIADRYLVVSEERYYSLWALDLVQSRSIRLTKPDHDLELQQASIWLFQELWLQWQDLLGKQQLQSCAENLLIANSRLKSAVAFDRLLNLDPLTVEKLPTWVQSDFIAFDRQLYHLTQQKIGREFGTRLTIDIIESMPDALRLTLIDVLDIKA